MSDPFSERLQAARKAIGQTVVGIAQECGVSRGTWTRYEAGANRPDADTLAVLHAHGIDINWLLSGEGEMMRGSTAHPSGAVPVVGLAECGLRGWYQATPTGLYASAPPRLAADPGSLAVIAIGESMRPAGIVPGDMVFCTPASERKPGGNVLVELSDGTMAIKMLVGVTPDWLTLQGWLDAPEGGVQMPYRDERRSDQIRRLWTVAMVQPGLAQQMMPGGAGAEMTADDRLYEIAARATLGWFESGDLAPPKPEALAGMISRAARMLRGRADHQHKTDAELEQEVTLSLDQARGILASMGWRPE